ncbi:hypothetical protein S40293_10515 [Stachybotrys chartarum IBT 40293]|nr:hypothetical protein S40293_10515 [Stachybotrys chartarum IBT 40293]
MSPPPIPVLAVQPLTEDLSADSPATASELAPSTSAAIGPTEPVTSFSSSSSSSSSELNGLQGNQIEHDQTIVSTERHARLEVQSYTASQTRRGISEAEALAEVEEIWDRLEAQEDSSAAGQAAIREKLFKGWRHYEGVPADVAMRALEEIMEEMDAMSDHLTPYGSDTEAIENDEFRPGDDDYDEYKLTRALERTRSLWEEEEE